MGTDDPTLRVPVMRFAGHHTRGDSRGYAFISETGFIPGPPGAKRATPMLVTLEMGTLSESRACMRRQRLLGAKVLPAMMRSARIEAARG
jgi:hypothetical protein